LEENSILSHRSCVTPDPSNEFVRELRACEVRTHYSALDPLQLKTELLSWASDVRFHERVAAIIDSPVELVDAETAQQARQTMAATTSPETARAIAELKASHDAVLSAVRSGMAHLRRNGLGPEDPLLQIAREGNKPRHNYQIPPDLVVNL
jgi:hypothetical protein